MDISTNDEATVINIEGVEQNAKEFLCQNKAVVKIALEALRNVFKNPILTQEQYDALCATYGQIPSYAHPNGVKIPLAFILDKVLHLRGYRRGHAWLFGKQPLVLVADLGAAAEEVEALAAFITERVRDVAGLSIEREVRTLNA